MMDYYQRIDDYISGRLSSEETKAFAKAMSEDPDLKRAVENYDIVSQALELLEEEDIRGIINNIDQEDSHNTEKVIQLPRQRKLYYMAAAFVFLFVAAFVVDLYLQSKYSHSTVLAEYYIRPYNPDNTRSSQSTKNTLESGIYLFDLGRTKESKDSLSLVLSSSTDEKELNLANFYLGTIAYEEGELVIALQYLSETPDDRKYDYLGQIYFIQRDVASLQRLYESTNSKLTKELLELTSSWEYRWID